VILDTSPNQHLAMEELARLLEEARQREHSELRVEAHPHLAACPTCREEFESLAELESQLRMMRAEGPAAETPRCPRTDQWGYLAAGLIDSEQSSAHLEHASSCDHCGPLLSSALAEWRSLNRELSPTEREAIAVLDSAKAEWQMRLAERITGTIRRDPVGSDNRWKGWLSIPALTKAGVAAALLAGAAWWTIAGRETASAANDLVARAYTDQRTLELRIPGAAYAPLRVQKGPAESFAARPPALLKAEAMIASRIASHPDDPDWLQAAARANLLEGKYDAAVESLQRALELRPDSPELLLDLGTAHFQRAQSEDRQEDYGAAFEYLSKVLKLQPQNATALFNRAIVGEHQFLYHQALEDWENYLKADPSSQWAEEARNHADAVRTKLKEHGQARPLLAPSELTPAVMDTEVDARVEEYLGEAVRKWLPSAFPESGTREADPGAQRALFLLADLTARNHGDRWLADLLQGSSSKQFAPAVAALARSAAANDAGDYAVSAEQGARAEQLFRTAGNKAGVLRAQFEQVFAAQLTRRSDECRRDAITALKESERYPYLWLQIQLGLEKGVCSELQGDLGTLQKSASKALDRANKAGYGGAYLRSVGFVSDYQFGAGNFPEAAKLVAKGMESYWSGQFAALRGYSLYNLLGSYADAAKEPDLKVAVWLEAVALIDSDKDLAMRGGAHSLLANAAASAHQLRLAQVQYAEAARLLALAPRTGASVSNALENEIRVAQLETREGHLDAAMEQLARNQNLISQLPDAYLGQMYYSALGELELRNQQPSNAEQAFRSALALVERKLASLNREDERIVWSNDAAPLYLAMSEAKLVQGRAQESLAVYEWFLGAAQRTGDGSNSAPTGEPDPMWLASRLPLLSRETVVAYGVLPDGVAIWTYDNRGVNAQWFPTASSDLREVGERFYDSCSNPHSEMSAFRRDAHNLYAALIAPIERQLEPARTLVIEANGWLARVPFEALLDANGHALIERWPIVHSLGEYSEERMQSDGTISPAQHALVVASTTSSQSQDLIPLPDVEAEAAMVAAGFRSADVLKAQDATLEAVTARLPSAGIFHFTGHSLASPQHAGLVLAGPQDKSEAPSLLEASYLRRLDLQFLQLVVLSTCSTESGPDVASGFGNITEAFERSGVPHVVASRWAVDSIETRRLMQTFYHQVLSGQAVSAALRSSAQQMLSDPHTTHPYFWAAFAAYGQP